MPAITYFSQIRCKYDQRFRDFYYQRVEKYAVSYLQNPTDHSSANYEHITNMPTSDDSHSSVQTLPNSEDMAYVDDDPIEPFDDGMDWVDGLDCFLHIILRCSFNG